LNTFAAISTPLLSDQIDQAAYLPSPSPLHPT
jgi:hypothetical protein